MKNVKDLKLNDAVYMVDRSSWDPKDRIVRLTVILKEGELYAYSKRDIGSILFRLSEVTSSKVLFATREDAEREYNNLIEREIQSIVNLSKETILNSFYREYFDGPLQDNRIYRAMEKKIKDEFGITVESILA